MTRKGTTGTRLVAGLKLLVIDLLSMLVILFVGGLIFLIGAFDPDATMIFGIIFVLIVVPLSFWVKGWVAEAVWGWR